jgi:hypothetical protein
MSVKLLPDVINNMIFLYLQSPEAKMIKDELKIYETDHCDRHTHFTRNYYIKNIISFSQYYFDKLRDPLEYESCQIEYAKTGLIKY